MTETDLLRAIAGLTVGGLIGLSGAGGGALMTPLLVFFFGDAAGVAKVSGLIFSCLARGAGAAMHVRLGTVCWRVVFLLALGSVPGVVLARRLPWPATSIVLLSGLLGLALIAAGLRAVIVPRVMRSLSSGADPGLRLPVLTVLGGVVIGVFAASPVPGTGVLGLCVLRTLYPRTLRPVELVGTDLALAAPLTVLAGSGMLSLAPWHALMWLLAGGLPGVIAGSLLSRWLPAARLRWLLGLLMLAAGGLAVSAMFAMLAI
jgi:hypothetical protein